MFVGRVGAHDLFKTSLLLQKFKCEEMAVFRRLRESTPKLQLLTLRTEYGVVPGGCITTPCQGVQSPWLFYLLFVLPPPPPPQFLLFFSGRPTLRMAMSKANRNPCAHQRCLEGSNKPCVHPDPEIPQRLSQNCVCVSPVEVWSAVDCCRGRGSGCSRPGYGISPLGGKRLLPLNSTIQPPELTQDWGNRLLEGTNKSLCNQDPGERSRDPTRD